MTPEEKAAEIMDKFWPLVNPEPSTNENYNRQWVKAAKAGQVSVGLIVGLQTFVSGLELTETRIAVDDCLTFWWKVYTTLAQKVVDLEKQELAMG